MNFIFYSPSIGPPWDYRDVETGLGGSETYHVELAQRLAARGHNVTSYNNLTPNLSAQTAAYFQNGVMWKSNDKVDFRTAGTWVIQRSPAFIDRFPGTNLAQQHWLVFHDFDYGEATPERCAKYTRLITLSKGHQEYITSTRQHPSVALSAGGIPTERIESLPAPPRNPQRVIYTSTPDRGLEPLLKSFSRAKEVVPNLEMHCYYGWSGFDLRMSQDVTGELKRQKASIERLLMQEGVTFHGKVSQAELFNAYLQSGIWCYQTMYFEVFCCCAAEAQACGCVPIFNPLWALRDNVKHGVAIHGDAWKDRLVMTRYAYELARMATAPAVQEKIREEMMPWAREQFSWERVVDQFEVMAEQDSNPERAVSIPAATSQSFGDRFPKDKFEKRPDGTVFGGWFGDDNKRKLEELIAKYNVKSVIEIGSFLGYSTAWFARRVERVTCIDTFEEPATVADNNNLVGVLPKIGVPNDFYSHFIRNMEAEGVIDRINIVRGRSDLVHWQVLEADLVYIDGDHSYQGQKGDIIAYLPKARKVICGDDYTPQDFPGLIQATNELLPQHKHQGAFWWHEIPQQTKSEDLNVDTSNGAAVGAGVSREL